MRPDTPLCESLRPMRRRRQLLGRYPSFHAARPQLSPPSPRADLAVDRAWTRPDGGQGGRTGKFGQLGGGAGPQRPCPGCATRPQQPLLGRPRSESQRPLGRRGRDGRGALRRQGARFGAAHTGALRLLGVFPTPFTLSPWCLFAWHRPLPSFLLPSAVADPCGPSLWPLGNFLVPALCPVLISSSPSPSSSHPFHAFSSSHSSLPCPRFYPSSYLIIPTSYSLYQSAVFSFFLIFHLYLLSVCLSQSPSLACSSSLLLLISLIGSPAPAPLMSPIHSQA